MQLGTVSVDAGERSGNRSQRKIKVRSLVVSRSSENIRVAQRGDI